MPRRSRADPVALAQLLAPGRAVATHRELVELGLSPSTIVRRIGPGGPWQRLLPGVVAGHRGTPTRHERRLAALKHAGPGAALTGLDALALHGVRLGDPAGERVHVLVPHGVHRTSHGFALLTRTRRPPDVVVLRGLPCASVARAVVDAARRSELLGDVRELVAAAVQQRKCSVEDLLAEVQLAARQRTALSRAVLVEVGAGIRSVGEAELRAAFARYGVPSPRWNAPVRTADGELVAVVDGLWEDVAAYVELDSMTWHLSPAAFRATQRRQRKLMATGLRGVAVALSDIRGDPRGMCRDVMEFLRTCAEDRGLPWPRSSAV